MGSVYKGKGGVSMELKEGMMVRVRPGAGTMEGEKGEIVSSFEYTYLILTNSGLQEMTHTVCRVKFNLKGKNVTFPYLAEELEPVRVESIPYRSFVGNGIRGGKK